MRAAVSILLSPIHAQIRSGRNDIRLQVRLPLIFSEPCSSAVGRAAITERLNFNVSIYNTKIQAMYQGAIATLLFVSTLWDSYPLALCDVVIARALRHTGFPENHDPHSWH